jgi:serine/threonine protein kinase
VAMPAPPPPPPPPPPMTAGQPLVSARSPPHHSPATAHPLPHTVSSSAVLTPTHGAGGHAPHSASHHGGHAPLGVAGAAVAPLTSRRAVLPLGSAEIGAGLSVTGSVPGMSAGAGTARGSGGLAGSTQRRAAGPPSAPAAEVAHGALPLASLPSPARVRLKCVRVDGAHTTTKALLITATTRFHDLHGNLTAEYGFPPLLHYRDGEGDRIELASQSDLAALYAWAKETQQGAGAAGGSGSMPTVVVSVTHPVEERAGLGGWPAVVQRRDSGKGGDEGEGDGSSDPIGRGGSSSASSPRPPGGEEGSTAAAAHLQPGHLPGAPSLASNVGGGSADGGGGVGGGGGRDGRSRASGGWAAMLARAPSPSPLAFRWQRGQVLGRGAYGVVYQGLKATGEMMAVKQLDTRGISPAELTEVEREVSLLQSLDHDNIVRYYGTQRGDGTLSIFLEYASGGSIRQVLERFGPLEEPVVRNYTRQLLLGLEYLHRHQIAHRDLKGGNILVGADGVVKLADFGASQRVGSTTGAGLGPTARAAPARRRGSAGSTGDGGDQASVSGVAGVVGTPLWMAPEVIKFGTVMVPEHVGAVANPVLPPQVDTGAPPPLTDAALRTFWKKADIWSVGCVVIEMATGRPPWSDCDTPMAAMFRIASTDDMPAFPPHASSLARDFLSLCLQRDPTRRPDVTRLLLHPFVAPLPQPHHTLPRAMVAATAGPATTSGGSSDDGGDGDGGEGTDGSRSRVRGASSGAARRRAPLGTAGADAVGGGVARSDSRDVEAGRGRVGAGAASVGASGLAYALLPPRPNTSMGERDGAGGGSRSLAAMQQRLQMRALLEAGERLREVERERSADVLARHRLLAEAAAAEEGLSGADSGRRKHRSRVKARSGSPRKRRGLASGWAGDGAATHEARVLAMLRGASGGDDAAAAAMGSSVGGGVGANPAPLDVHGATRRAHTALVRTPGGPLGGGTGVAAGDRGQGGAPAADGGAGEEEKFGMEDLEAEFAGSGGAARTAVGASVLDTLRAFSLSHSSRSSSRSTAESHRTDAEEQARAAGRRGTPRSPLRDAVLDTELPEEDVGAPGLSASMRVRGHQGGVVASDGEVVDDEAEVGVGGDDGNEMHAGATTDDAAGEDGYEEPAGDAPDDAAGDGDAASVASEAVRPASQASVRPHGGMGGSLGASGDLWARSRGLPMSGFDVDHDWDEERAARRRRSVGGLAPASAETTPADAPPAPQAAATPPPQRRRPAPTGKTAPASGVPASGKGSQTSRAAAVEPPTPERHVLVRGGGRGGGGGGRSPDHVFAATVTRAPKPPTVLRPSPGLDAHTVTTIPISPPPPAMHAVAVLAAPQLPSRPDSPSGAEEGAPAAPEPTRRRASPPPGADRRSAPHRVASRLLAEAGGAEAVVPAHGGARPPAAGGTDGPPASLLSPATSLSGSAWPLTSGLHAGASAGRRAAPPARAAVPPAPHSAHAVHAAPPAAAPAPSRRRGPPQRADSTPAELGAGVSHHAWAEAGVAAASHSAAAVAPHGSSSSSRGWVGDHAGGHPVGRAGSLSSAASLPVHGGASAAGGGPGGAIGSGAPSRIPRYVKSASHVHKAARGPASEAVADSDDGSEHVAPPAPAPSPPTVKPHAAAAPHRASLAPAAAGKVSGRPHGRAAAQHAVAARAALPPSVTPLLVAPAAAVLSAGHAVATLPTAPEEAGPLPALSPPAMDAVDVALSAPPSPHGASSGSALPLFAGFPPPEVRAPSRLLGSDRPATRTGGSGAPPAAEVDVTAGMGAAASAALDDAVASSLRLIRAKSATRHHPPPSIAAATESASQHGAPAPSAASTRVAAVLSQTRGHGIAAGGSGAHVGAGASALTPALAAGAAVMRSTRATSVEEPPSRAATVEGKHAAEDGGGGGGMAPPLSPPTLTVPELSLLHASALRGFKGYAEQHAARVAIATARGTPLDVTPPSTAPTSPLGGGRSPLGHGSRRGSPGPAARSLPLSASGYAATATRRELGTVREDGPALGAMWSGGDAAGHDIRGGVAFPPSHSPIRLSPSPAASSPAASASHSAVAAGSSTLSSPGMALRSISMGGGSGGGGARAVGVARPMGAGAGSNAGAPLAADPSAVARTFRQALHPPLEGGGGGW